MEDERLESEEPKHGDVDPGDDHLYLLGTPPVRDFMELVRSRATDLQCAPEGILAAQWRRASDHIRGLEALESGSFGDAPISEMSGQMAELAERQLQDPGIQRSVALLPHRWVLVDLTRLIVHQRSVDLSYIKQLSTTFPQKPTDEQLFEFAAGNWGQPPAISVTRASENIYTFSSPSADLRVLDLALLDPGTVSSYQAPGHAVRLVGVFVGFGANFVSALRMENRLILTNGTHRAYMLYDRGIRRVPCLVREVSRDDDLDLVGANDVKQSLSEYLRARRPPLLKDFFDPRLCKVIRGAAARRLIHVQVNVQRARIALG